MKYSEGKTYSVLRQDAAPDGYDSDGIRVFKTIWHKAGEVKGKNASDALVQARVLYGRLVAVEPLPQGLR